MNHFTDLGKLREAQGLLDGLKNPSFLKLGTHQPGASLHLIYLRALKPMLCKPCSCAHKSSPDAHPTWASPSGKAIKIWSSFPSHRSTSVRCQAKNTWRRQAYKNRVTAQAVQQLWQVICQPDPMFQSTIHRLAGNNDIQNGDWHQQGGRRIREEQYTKSLKRNSIGPTEALCIDQQQCIHHSNAGFAVERKVYTPKVPFGGSFYNLVYWCAWNEGGSGKVRLQVSCDVVYTNKWVPAKSIITSSSTEGMKEYYNMWLEQLYDHLKFPDSPSKSVDTVPPTIRTSRADLQIEP